MAEKKMKGFGCECGGTFKVKETVVNEVATEAMVCDGCSYTTLTMDQAKYVTHIGLLQARLSKTRKVVRIGNSIGVTLPDEFAKAGQFVKMVAKGDRTLEITVQ